ncbi:alkaline phosphatase family protein [Pseudogracilibacillus auburnensis]|uniref:alkaline phosphatase family protein n=1 Tax=Pseudogracilibacillus auburnensis TaxID=1494959 RepID=UPI001A972572|nr:alkaline phosphatase family protein [Pseudogracilibacillus auburnensis]MBO1003723.1 alkaline phosphatase family protein [Pseudogracilibacillus auburnensis]
MIINMSDKPVILLNIDSLMPNPLEIAIQTGRAPALQFLMEKGSYYPNMVSSFPTMSVTIDSSLLTGTYANKHQVPGLTWFDDKEKKIVNYGTGFTETFRLGMRKTIHQMLYDLNHKHLSNEVTTIYEELAKKGISSASINTFVYRGNTPQKMKVPRLFQTLTTFKDGKWTAEAPPVLSLGAFSKIRSGSFTYQIAAGNYKYTAKELLHLIRKRHLPKFTLCTFQDLDARIHLKGPMDMKGISKIDKEIQKILNMFSTWEKAIDEVVWLVMGDNGHAPMRHKYKEAMIDLRKVLKDYKVAKIERPIRQKDQLVFCVNQRMAYIYLLDEAISFEQIIKQLRQDDRIDIIACKGKDGVNVTSGSKKGFLRYDRGCAITDVYEQHWNIEGDLDLLDLDITEGNKISFDDYPDVLARLHGALHSHTGRFLVVNAKPGYDFKAQHTPPHFGAAHGSLHKQESLVPLIIAGTAEAPIYPRIINLKEFILRIIH